MRQSGRASRTSPWSAVRGPRRSSSPWSLGPVAVTGDWRLGEWARSAVPKGKPEGTAAERSAGLSAFTGGQRHHIGGLMQASKTVLQAMSASSESAQAVLS